jgi:3-hydroxybutyryl-CoA dehydrogenase
MEINSICVCGAGTMGSGIAQAAAQSGFYTILFDLNTDVLSSAEKNINASLSALVAKEKISEVDSNAIIKRLYFTNDIHTCLADIFIEAIVEKIEAKVALFNQLAELNHSECVFATNTSSLSITSIASLVQRPERIIGMHFFNPATIMKLVEVVTTVHTNEQTKETILSLVTQMNKMPVLCKDAPGFIVNRVARPYYIEALRIAEEGVPLEQVDGLMENAGFKLGPFKLMDLIGNDVNYAVSCSVFEQLGKPERLQPSDIQKEKVTSGKLGKKTGEGYYKY